MAVKHEITERPTPINYLVMCTCGWQYQTTRRQNARARASKIRAAIRQHLEHADDSVAPT